MHGATPHPQGLRLDDGPLLAEADVVWLPPFEVGTIIALGLNYAARLGELALEAGIPAGVRNIVHGSGRTAGEPLCSHPDVRAISFTGSTATVQRIVSAPRAGSSRPPPAGIKESGKATFP